MEEDFEENNGVDVYVEEHSASTITIPILGDIGSPEKYNDVYYYLSSATPSDSVEILINSGGGRVDGALHIVSGIQACNAGKITAKITGECASAATFPFFAARHWVVPEYASMLLHSTSFGTGGITNHVLQMSEHEKRYLKVICETFYKGFLTQQEIKDLMRGDQLYFLSEEIVKRLNRRITYLNKDQSTIKEEGWEQEI